MTLKGLIKKVQSAIGVTPDGDWGPVSAAKADEFEITVTVKRKEKTAPVPAGEAPPWYKFAKKYQGKKETDPAFNKEMSAKWSLVGLNLGTIAKNWAAWCGLAIAVSLAGVGYKVQRDGAAAKNWARYGVEIEYKKVGIPKGAIVYINHSANCGSGSGNHVTMSDGDCAPEDLKAGTFNGYGGNQGNEWKVSPFPVAHICAVRWPAEAALPPPVTQSAGCKGKASSGESTR